MKKQTTNSDSPCTFARCVLTHNLKNTISAVFIFSAMFISGNAIGQYSEDFEIDPPTGWTFFQSEGDDPGFVQTSTRVHEGTYSFYHNDDNLTAVSDSWMISPSITITSNEELKFWYNQNFTGSYYDYSGVWISTDSNDPITNPADFTELQQLNASAPGGFSEDEWTEFVLSLSAYAGNDVHIAFKYTGDWSHELYIDTFSVQTPPSCTTPTNFNVPNVTATSVQLGWDQEPNASSYDWEIVPPGDGQGNNVVAFGNETGTSVSVTALMSNTEYDAYIRSDCGGGDTSAWLGPVNFFTGYCDATPSSNDGDGISQIDFNGNVIPSSGDVTFEDFTSTIVDIQQAVTANLDITFTTGFTYDTNIWIDFNDNLIFEASELVFQGESTSANPTTLDASFPVDINANLGNHRMRIGTADSGQSTPNPCYTGTYGVTIDVTVNVTPAPACLTPTGLSESSVTATSVQLDWDPEPTASNGYDYFITSDGTVPDETTTPTGSEVSGTTANISGLMPNTDYDAYIRSDCGGGDVSDWSLVPVSFTTLCDAITSTSFPYNQDFDGTWSGSPAAPECWKVVNNDNDGNTWSQASTYITARSAPSTAHGMGNSDDYLISPAFQIPAGEFYEIFWYDIVESATKNNTYDVLISTTNTNIASFTDNLGTFDTTNTSWEERNLDLSAYTGQTIYIAFHQTFSASTIFGFGLDDFSFSEIPSCITPTGLSESNITSTSVQLDWVTESTPSDGYDYFITSDGTVPDETTTATGSEASGTTANISGLMPNTDYDAYIRSDCGGGDTSAWLGPVSFTTVCATETLPWTEDFENGGVTPDCWTESGGESWNFDVSADVTGEHVGNNGTIIGSTESGNYFAWIDDSGSDSPSTLTSPQVDLNTLTTPQLSFYLLSDNEDNSNATLDVEVYDGSTWNNVGTFNSNTSGWEKKIILLSSLTFSGAAQVRFTITESGQFYDDIAIDDITFEEAPTCTPPTNFDVPNFTVTTADLDWDPVASATSGYDWVIVASGDDPDVGPFADSATGVTGTSDSASGLSGNTDYDAYIRSDCGGGDKSDWSNPVYFTTPCDVYSIPFTEDFSSTSTTERCWTVVDNNNDDDQWNTNYELNPLVGDEVAVLYTDLNNGNNDDYLITPTINLTGNEQIRFSYRVQSTIEPSDFQVTLSTTGTDIANFTNTLLALDTYSNTTYVEKIIDISAYTGNVNIAFHVPSGGLDGWRIYIDDVNIEEKPSCITPAGLIESNVTSTSVQLDWDTESTASNGYDYFITSDGTVPDETTTATGSEASGTTANISGLMPNTDYDAYIRSDCGGDDTSAWLGPVSFSTPLVEATPWEENFDVTGQDGWTTSGFDFGNVSFGNVEGRDASDVLYRNLYGTGTNSSGDFETVSIGPIQVGDYLSYEYKLSNWSSPYGSPDAGACDFTVKVTGSNSGEVTVQNFTNDGKLGWHKKYIDLSGFVGEEIFINVDAQRNSGDFYLFFDNFAVKSIDGYVYANDTDGWLTGTPVGASTSTDDVEIVEGSTSFASDVDADNLAIFIQADLDVESVINLDGELFSNGETTFKSTSSGTAQVGDISSFNGEVTVERYIPARRAFRFLASSVNSTNPIYDNWQEGGNAITTPISYGTHISGAGLGFDDTDTGNPSMFLFDNEFLADQPGETQEDAWSPIPNTNSETLEIGEPYLLMVRGDRTIDLNSNAPTPNNTTLRAKGALQVGDFSPTLSDVDAFFSLIANPYQSIVDFTALTFTGDVNNNNMYIWNPNVGTRGAYETIDMPAEQFMQPAQSVFVQNSMTVSTTPTITFTESAKNTSGLVTNVFSTSQIAQANLELYNSDNLKLDEMKFRFEANANNGIDDFDGGKLTNPDENLASVNGNTLLSVERRDIPQADDIVPLFIDQYRFTQYEFNLNLVNWDTNINVYVVDNYLNTETLIDANQNYSFSIDANIPASIATDRFSLNFDNTTLGIDDNVFGKGFSLYPNPTDNGLFTIKTSGLNGDNVVIKMHNMLGQQVLKSTLTPENNGDVMVDANGLSSGVYIVELIQDKDTFTGKLIIE